MLLRLLKAISSVVLFPFKLMRCRKRQRNSMFQNPDIKSGIYIVKYSKNRIKIGRSKHIEKRLKSYRGYQKNGNDIERLLIINTHHHKQLESHIHKFAIQYGLRRLNRTEVFECSNQKKFIKKVKQEYIQWQQQYIQN